MCSGCFDVTRPDTESGGITMAKGTVDLRTALKSMNNPRGIMPRTLGLEELYPQIILRDNENYHEYFAFDRHRCVVLLSSDPVYFMVINSPEFYRHMLSEYEQIENNVSPANKILNTVDNYKTVGDYEVGVFFTPKEMKYYQGRFQDSVSTTYCDPYRLYNAAEKVWFYTPVFKEETIYTDLLEKWLINKESIIQYTRQDAFSSEFNNQYITYYTKSDIYCNFSFIIGEDLLLTDELLGTNDVNFENQLELTRDFSIFVSVPLGNSQDTSEAYLSDESASSRHGVCVVIRGKQDYFKNFLSKENISFSPDEQLPLSLVVKDTYSSNSLGLDWGIDNGEMNLWIKTENNDYPDSPETTVSGMSHTLNALQRGNYYTFKLTQKGNDANILAETSAYFTDLLVTEICYWGSSYPGTIDDDETKQRGSNADDWIEIKNISGTAVDMSGLVLYWYNSNKKRDVWFSPYESGSYGPLTTVLGPGERIVISNDNNDEYFFKYYSPPPGVTLVKEVRGSKSSVYLGENYTVQLVKGERTVQNILIDGEYGEKAPFKSMVLSSNGTWQTSTINSGTNPVVPLGRNTVEMLYNYCTPGYAADGEF